MSVEIEFPGRFGNNLFQYLYGRIFAAHYGLKLKSEFPYPDMMTMTPFGNEGEDLAGPPLEVNDADWDLNTSRQKGKYLVKGFFQDAKFFWERKGLIDGFAKPTTPVEPMPESYLAVNMRIGPDYRSTLAIHPSWYQKILANEPYEKLFVIADHDDEEYISHALSGHSCEVVIGSPKEQWDFMRRFQRLVCSNSTFTWWVPFFGHTKKTFIFSRWIGNSWVNLTSFPGAVRVEGKFLHEEPLSWGQRKTRLEWKRQDGLKKNLCFYVYPRHSEGWRWHVKRLKAFLPIFTGRKLVTIATDESTEPAARVIEEFNDTSIEFTEVKNDKELWETKHFVDTIGKLQSYSDKEATFYCHAKGVIHSEDQIRRVWKWCDAMYEMNLSSPMLVERLLSQYSSIGCYKFNFSPDDWFYAGTFFWFKHSAIFGADWTRIGPDKYAVEKYLCGKIKSDQAYTLSPFFGGGELYGKPPGPELYRGWLKEHMDAQGVVESSLLGQTMEIESLDSIAHKHGSDKKCGYHGFTTHYEKWFASRRMDVRKILEIGVLNGASLRMWEEYFPQATIVALDNNPDCTKHSSSRSTVVTGDQNNESHLNALLDRFGKDFDLIIDDGCHYPGPQKTSFKTLFSALKRNGVYVIEDLHTSYWESYGGSLTEPNSIMSFVKMLMDEVNKLGMSSYGHHEMAMSEIKGQGKTLSAYAADISSIQLFPSIVFIEHR